MARESKEALSNPVALQSKQTPYLEPNQELNAQQRYYWDITVRCRPATYFKDSDQPMLTAYVRHCAEIDRLSSLIEEIHSHDALDEISALQKCMSMRKEETSKMMACARSMRLTHQSTYDEKTASTAAKHASSGGGGSSAKPWEV